MLNLEIPPKLTLTDPQQIHAVLRIQQALREERANVDIIIQNQTIVRVDTTLSERVK